MAVDNDQVERLARKINVDVLSGWEAGIQGRQRVHGALVDRTPPEHLTGQRLADWHTGREAAAKLLSTRMTIFTAKSVKGEEIKVTKKGWVHRWPTVIAICKKGVIGGVDVFYMEEAEIVRKHNCST